MHQVTCNRTQILNHIGTGNHTTLYEAGYIVVWGLCKRVLPSCTRTAHIIANHFQAVIKGLNILYVFSR